MCPPDSEVQDLYTTYILKELQAARVDHSRKCLEEVELYAHQSYTALKAERGAAADVDDDPTLPEYRTQKEQWISAWEEGMGC